MKYLYKYPLTALSLVCIGIFFFHLDAFHINIMEARNFITAREMVNDGNWLLTTINGLPRYEKPPLPTWLTAFSGILFGFKSLFAMRLPVAIMSLILILISYKFLLKLSKNPIYALVSALVMATSFYIIVGGRDANWDMFSHSFMMLCIYFLFLLFTSHESRYKNAFLAAFFFACSFMSKGPVSMYTLMLPFLIAFGVVYKYKNFKSPLLPILFFLLLTLFFSGWWHLYVYEHDMVNIQKVTEKEIGNWQSYKVKPFYYYWTFLRESGLWLILGFMSLLYPYLKNRVFDKKAYLFTFLWTVGSLVLLSIVPEKKVRYLLPVFIPLAMNTGFYIEFLFRKFKELKDIKQTFPVYLSFGLVAIFGLAFPFIGYFIIEDLLKEVNWYWFSILSFATILIGFFMLKNLIKKNIPSVFLLSISLIVSLIVFGMPLLKTFNLNPAYKSLNNLKKWEAETQLKVYDYGLFTPEFIWSYGQSMKQLEIKNSNDFPDEEAFGVLIFYYEKPRLELEFGGNYTIENIERYDMNFKAAPGEKGHKNRLYKDLYVLRKRK